MEEGRGKTEGSLINEPENGIPTYYYEFSKIRPV